MSPDTYDFTEADRQLLREVDHWPLVCRQSWANRALEIARRQHIALEKAEAMAASALIDKVNVYIAGLKKGKKDAE